MTGFLDPRSQGREIAEHRAEETFRRAFEQVAFGMVLVGSDGGFLEVNLPISHLPAPQS